MDIDATPSARRKNAWQEVQNIERDHADSQGGADHRRRGAVVEEDGCKNLHPCRPMPAVGPECLSAEFISPKKLYTFSSIGDPCIPKNVKCTHSATKMHESG